MEDRPDDLLRLPEGLDSPDPIDGNPFPESDVRHGFWKKATKEAEAEHSTLIAESFQRPRPKDPSKADAIVAWDIAFITARYDIWARRGVRVVLTDEPLDGWYQWLANYANEALKGYATFAPPEEAIQTLRDALIERREHWKAEGRRCVQLQQTHQARFAAGQQSPERAPDSRTLAVKGNAPDMPSPSEMARFRKQGRRYRAQRAALYLVFAVHLAADAELLQDAANAVQQSWPRDSHHLEQVLWRSFSKYSITLLNKLAEARLSEVRSDRAVRRYVHWLRCTCITAVVEDRCTGMRFSDVAKHIFDVIGDVRWPEHAQETRRAIARLMTEVLGGPHSENLEKRLRVLLDARIGHWEAAAIQAADKGKDSELAPIPEREVRRRLEGEPDEALRRRNLLAEYKKGTGDPSNKRIYEAKNSGIHKPQFYQWLKGDLSSHSETTINFERFLAEKKAPVPRTPRP